MSVYIGKHSDETPNVRNKKKEPKRGCRTQSSKELCEVSYDVEHYGEVEHRMIPCQFYEGVCINPKTKSRQTCDLLPCPKGMEFTKHSKRKNFCGHVWDKVTKWYGVKRHTREECEKAGFLVDNGWFHYDAKKLMQKGYAYPCYWRPDDPAKPNGSGTCLGSVKRVAPCIAPKNGDLKEYEKNLTH